jgi:hypothetical protein
LVQILSVDSELAAFVEGSRRNRPMAWAAVERLQRAYRVCQPSTSEGSVHAIEVLRRIDLTAAAPVPSGFGLLIEGWQGR